jgi:peptidoglycan hydrolase-like protein with peptidoglycan-binding domain
MNSRQGKKRRFQVEALEGRIALGAVAHGVGPAPPAHVQTAATSIQAAATSLPVLQIGSSGHYVTILQQDLWDLGLFYLGTTGPHHNGVDGEFGPLTQSAVEQFQYVFHLHVDGIVGPQTWGELQALGLPV